MTQLFLGFMDEEVADVLENLIALAAEEQRPVIVIERGAPDQLRTRLFERSMDDYTRGGISLSVREISMRAPPSSLREIDLERLASRLDAPAFLNLRESRANKAMQIKVKGKLCMLTMTPKSELSSHNPPYILVRSPEMGLQPDLTRMWLNTIFGALADIGIKDLEISCFGAGGAAAFDLKPGEVHDVDGSFYVGVQAKDDADDSRQAGTKASASRHGGSSATNEKAPKEPDARGTAPVTDENKFYGVVKFAARTAVPDGLLAWANDEREQRFDFELFRSNKLYGYREAAALATHVFCVLAGADRLIRGPWGLGDPKLEPLPAELAMGSTTLAKRINDLKTVVGTYNGKSEHSISLTASFFVGGEVKIAARCLKIADVNMEDYHVVRVLNSDSTGVKIAAGSKITRVHCDPPKTPGRLKLNFQKWAHDAEYTLAQFKAAVRWGLDGCRLDKLPPEAQWTLAGQLRDAVYTCKRAGYKDTVLDPFFSEIASDFLATVRDEGAFPETKMKDTIVRALSDDANRILRTRDNTTIDKLIDGMYATMLDRASYSSGQSPFLGPKGGLRIWLRPYKWTDSRQQPNTKVVINQVEWEGARIDRALYKSTNQIVLQEMARERVRGKPSSASG